MDKNILKKISKNLTNEFGLGFSLSGLYNMRLFYIKYKNFQPLARNLNWSHYCYLIYIEDEYERIIARKYELVWYNIYTKYRRI